MKKSSLFIRALPAALLLLGLAICSTAQTIGQYSPTDPVTLHNAATATGNGSTVFVRNHGGVRVEVTGSFSATITFEATSALDGTGYTSVQAVNAADGTVSATATANGHYFISLAGFETFRARISAYTSGSVTVKARSVPTLQAGAGKVSGAVTADQGAAAALSGAWPVKLTDGTNTAPTMDAAARAGFQKITDGTNTATVTASSALKVDGSAVTQPVSFTVVDPCASATIAKSSAVINATADAQLVALQSSQIIYVCSVAFTVSGTTPTARFQYGTGTTCATGTTQLTGQFGASVSIAGPGTLFKSAASNALCINVGGSSPSIQGFITYVQQ